MLLVECGCWSVFGCHQLGCLTKAFRRGCETEERISDESRLSPELLMKCDFLRVLL